MIITAYSPEVVVLQQVWSPVDRRTEGLAEGLKRRLTRHVILPAIQSFQGELILKYQEFLAMVPSGFHSFTHGSEMISKTVRWVSVARLSGGEIKEVCVEHHPLRAQGMKFTFTTPSKVLVPVYWEYSLEPRYRRGIMQPYFALGKVAEGNSESTDYSLLGHHLFRFTRSDLDWATKIEIVVGNESVGAWLRERKSAQTFNMLMRR